MWIFLHRNVYRVKRKTERRVEFAEIGKRKKRQATAAQVASACQPLSLPLSTLLLCLSQ